MVRPGLIERDWIWRGLVSRGVAGRVMTVCGVDWRAVFRHGKPSVGETGIVPRSAA